MAHAEAAAAPPIYNWGWLGCVAGVRNKSIVHLVAMPWEVKQGTQCCSVSSRRWTGRYNISIPLLSLMTPLALLCSACAPPTVEETLARFARSWLAGRDADWFFDICPAFFRAQLLRLHLKRTSWAIRLVFHFAPFSFRNPFFLFFLSTQASAKKIDEFTIFFKWNWILQTVYPN